MEFIGYMGGTMGFDLPPETLTKILVGLGGGAIGLFAVVRWLAGGR